VKYTLVWSGHGLKYTLFCSRHNFSYVYDFNMIDSAGNRKIKMVSRHAIGLYIVWRKKSALPWKVHLPFDLDRLIFSCLHKLRIKLMHDGSSISVAFQNKFFWNYGDILLVIFNYIYTFFFLKQFLYRGPLNLSTFCLLLSKFVYFLYEWSWEENKLENMGYVKKKKKKWKNAFIQLFIFWEPSLYLYNFLVRKCLSILKHLA
jgi:hypothetical protein